jgi:hypothetical protein
MSALINRRKFLIRSGAAAGLLLGGCAHRKISENEERGAQRSARPTGVT